MNTIIGIVVVFGSIIGGFVLHEGNLHVLFQPSEFLIIGGAGIGSMIVMAPPKLLKKVLASIPRVFQGTRSSKAESLEILSLLYEIFAKLKRDGTLSIDQDVEDPHQSEIFRKYPSFLRNHAAVALLCDTLRLFTMGASVRPHDLDELMSVEIECHEEDEGRVSGALSTLADSASSRQCWGSSSPWAR